MRWWDFTGTKIITITITITKKTPKKEYSRDNKNYVRE